MTDVNVPDKVTVGQALKRLRDSYDLHLKDVAAFLKTNHTSYRNIERDQRELSFIMAIRLCEFYNIGLNELVGMLREDELDRKELSSLKYFAKMEKRKKEKGNQQKIIQKT